MVNTQFDIAIIGGGINGAGIARAAAGQGVSVILIEQNDLASATSSASSKLVHGGLRYLEHGEIKLVKESLHERERLLAIAPHLVRPMTFLLPLSKMSARPGWMVGIGLKLYDFLAGTTSSLPRSKAVKLKNEPQFAEGLSSEITQGFTYSDCWVDDARLVVLNALDAKERGAEIRTQTRCTAIKHEGDGWQLSLEHSGETQAINARIIVNAAGPWANDLVQMASAHSKGRIARVKGSHIVVPRVHGGEHACLLQMPDKRIIFLLPFEQNFTLIGTTDFPFDGDAGGVQISEEEIDYLLDGANRYLATKIMRSDMRWCYAGVRALYDDGKQNLSAKTRDYVLELAETEAPFLSVFGGKITTYRMLAENVMAKLSDFIPPLGKNMGWTGETPLPGGDARPDVLMASLKTAYDFVPEKVLARWVRQYGTRVHTMLEKQTLGDEIIHGVFECELIYARDYEWATTADDFLWRRTKLGLHLDEPARMRIVAWFESSQRISA